MYAVTLLKRSTKEVLNLICFVNSMKEFDQKVGEIVSQYGAEWIWENDFDFGFELAI